MAINRFDVYLANLDPNVGSEIRKTRPCLVVSPDEINHTIRTLIIAPLTTKGQNYPTRIPCRFKGKVGQMVLDQIRNVDRSRLITKLGRIGGGTATAALDVLREMFEPWAALTRRACAEDLAARRVGV
jgi:mRNA interferase MazF